MNQVKKGQSDKSIKEKGGGGEKKGTLQLLLKQKTSALVGFIPRHCQERTGSQRNHASFFPIFSHFFPLDTSSQRSSPSKEEKWSDFFLDYHRLSFCFVLFGPFTTCNYWF